MSIFRTFAITALILLLTKRSRVEDDDVGDTKYDRLAFSQLKQPGLRVFEQGLTKTFNWTTYMKNLVPSASSSLKPGEWFYKGEIKTYLEFFKEWYDNCVKLNPATSSDAIYQQNEKISECFWKKIVKIMKKYGDMTKLKIKYKVFDEKVKKTHFSLDTEVSSFIANFMECEYMKGESSFCPNPCGLTRATNPCAIRINNVNKYDTTCTLSGAKLYTHDIRCFCMEGFVWSTGLANCVPADLCKKCFDKGTSNCTQKSVKTGSFFSQAIECVCNKQFAGPLCNEERDPCLHAPNGLPERFQGQYLCREFNTNAKITALPNAKCNGIKKSVDFSCTCPTGFIADPSIGFPNCYVDTSAGNNTLGCFKTCSGKRGYCMFNDYGAPICKCNDGFWGTQCEKKTTTWEAWTVKRECDYCKKYTKQKKVYARRHSESRSQQSNYPRKMLDDGTWVPDMLEEKVVQCPPYPCVLNGSWNSWNDWEKTCSKFCNSGIQTVRRSCEYGESSLDYNCRFYKHVDCITVVKGTPCLGPSFKIRSCNSRPCKEHEQEDAIVDSDEENEFDNWSMWSKCSEICGTGIQIQMRTCRKDSGLCDGAAYISRRCTNMTLCKGKEPYGEWESWSSCVYKNSKTKFKFTKIRCIRSRPCNSTKGCAGHKSMAALCAAGRCIGDDEEFYVATLYGIDHVKHFVHERQMGAKNDFGEIVIPTPIPQSTNNNIIGIVIGVVIFLLVIAVVAKFVHTRKKETAKKKEMEKIINEAKEEVRTSLTRNSIAIIRKSRMSGTVRASKFDNNLAAENTQLLNTGVKKEKKKKNKAGRKSGKVSKENKEKKQKNRILPIDNESFDHYFSRTQQENINIFSNV